MANRSDRIGDMGVSVCYKQVMQKWAQVESVEFPTLNAQRSTLNAQRSTLNKDFDSICLLVKQHLKNFKQGMHREGGCPAL